MIPIESELGREYQRERQREVAADRLVRHAPPRIIEQQWNGKFNRQVSVQRWITFRQTVAKYG